MSRFQSRSEFIGAASSEKITLAHVEARKRLYVWTSLGGGVYSKVVPYFVAGVKQDGADLSEVASSGAVVAGSFYYDVKSSTVFAHLTGSSDPATVEIIATYRLFFSDKDIQLSHDLADLSEEVQYRGRLMSAPGYKHKIGIDQSLTSLTGEGTLKLQNNDGGLDGIFDTLIFANQNVVIYSYNRDLQPSEARVIYRGRVTNSTYDSSTVSFKIKDQIFDLLGSPALDAYTAADNVNDSAQGQYKRRIYGRVDGLRCQSTDQIGDGFNLTGTLSAGANSTTINGTGTLFDTEVLQGDRIIVGLQEFTVNSIQSDTSLTLNDETDYGFGAETAQIVPARGTTLKNRTFLAAGHACATVTHTVTNALQFNRIQLDDTSGLFAGDFIEFTSTSERVEINNIAPNNVVVLVQNVITLPTVGTTAVRQPIQEVYVAGERVNSDDFTIFNTTAGCGVTLNDSVEFNLGDELNTTFTATFTNGSQNVVSTSTEVSLTDFLRPGDWIRPNSPTYTTYYRVQAVTDTTAILQATFTDPTITDQIEYISPDYITDDTIISVNILGRTVDGQPSGQWLTTAAEVHKDLLADVGITTVNTASFTEGSELNTQLVSMAVPENFRSKSLPTVKNLTDKLNRSVRASLTLDNDLLIKYQPMTVYSGSNFVEISDRDVINWKIKSTNGKAFVRALSKYRFSDVELSTLEAGNKFITSESDFVTNYIGTNKSDELDLYLYDEVEAEIATHRHLYYNRLGFAVVEAITDLRLENVEIGDVVILDFERLYQRFGDSAFRQKTAMVVGKELTGERTKLILSDLGNTFNTSGYITENTAPDYVSATQQQRLLNGFITDNQGIVENDEDSSGTNLIS